MLTTSGSRLEAFHADLAISWGADPSLYLPHAVAAYVSPAGIGVDDVDARKLLKDYAGWQVRSTLAELYSREGVANSFLMTSPDGDPRALASSVIDSAENVILYRRMLDATLGMINMPPPIHVMVASLIVLTATPHVVGEFLGVSPAKMENVIAALAREIFGAAITDSRRGTASYGVQVGDSHAEQTIFVSPDQSRPGHYLWCILLGQSGIAQGARFQLGPKAQALLHYLSTGERPATHADRT